MLKNARYLLGKNNLPILKPLRMKYSEVIKSGDVQKSTFDILSKNEQFNNTFTSKELSEISKTGSDLYLNPESKVLFRDFGIDFEDINSGLSLNKVKLQPKWKHQYLKNMLLLQNYDLVFREFLQASAQVNQKGLELTLEQRLFQYYYTKLRKVYNAGYQIDIQNLRTRLNYEVLRVEVYKNLKVNRFENLAYNRYKHSLKPHFLGNSCVFDQIGEDIGYFINDRPYIVATTMLVKTPMNLVIFNQNRTKALYGDNPQENTNNYIVRFESQFNLNDFGWILPTQNKPDRSRLTKITDFNNILRGNPYFTEKWDIVDENERFNYMEKNEEADKKVKLILQGFENFRKK